MVKALFKPDFFSPSGCEGGGLIKLQPKNRELMMYLPALFQVQLLHLARIYLLIELIMKTFIRLCYQMHKDCIFCLYYLSVYSKERNYFFFFLPFALLN